MALCLFPDGLRLERAVWAHVSDLLQAPARLSLARVLTLCLQCLGVSENATHQSRGHCPVESGQNT